MLDPAYAVLYRDTVDLVNDYGMRAEAALAEAEQVLNKAQIDHDLILGKAARLPDGRYVFKILDGKMYDQDGYLVDGPDADGIIWPDDTPSYEDYLSSKKTVSDAKHNVQLWQDYLIEVIGVTRDRLNDPENPPTPDELRDWQEKIVDEFPRAMNQQAVNIPSMADENVLAVERPRL